MHPLRWRLHPRRRRGMLCAVSARRCAMNGLMYFNWFLGPVLEATLLAFMIRRNLRATFPRFFTYILFQVIKSGVLFGIYHYYHDNYFDAYWAGNAVSILLAVTVMDEIWKNLFHGYAGIQDLGSILFRWACVVMFLIAIASAFPGRENNADRLVAAVLAFDRSMRLMQCGLFFLVLLLCRLLKHFWRHHVFGIALGFGIFASVELILVSILSRFGSNQIALISLIKSATYNAVTLLWISYLRQPSPVLSGEIDTADSLDTWNAELVTESSTTPGDETFLTMVEQAVERVLTRTSPWPRPATKGSRIVSRRPSPEDRN